MIVVLRYQGLRWCDTQQQTTETPFLLIRALNTCEVLISGKLFERYHVIGIFNFFKTLYWVEEHPYKIHNYIECGL